MQDRARDLVPLLGHTICHGRGFPASRFTPSATPVPGPLPQSHWPPHLMLASLMRLPVCVQAVPTQGFPSSPECPPNEFGREGDSSCSQEVISIHEVTVLHQPMPSWGGGGDRSPWMHLPIPPKGTCLS